MTIRRIGLKIGRNEACPCESGQKYKRCCGKPGAERDPKQVREERNQLLEKIGAPTEVEEELQEIEEGVRDPI